MSKNTCNFKVEDVLNYVNCNLSEDLSLDHLTSKFYMSKTYLNNMIKAHTGYTINQYIIKIRVETAKKLLRKGIPVCQIYEKIGFNNYSHFIRTFTKIVGISPKQYAINFEKSK
jgi:YesN/AraC family two-component response regulator